METEIDRIVVRLVGDASSYEQMLKQAEQSTVAASAAVTASVEKVTSAAQQQAAAMDLNQRGRELYNQGLADSSQKLQALARMVEAGTLSQGKFEDISGRMVRSLRDVATSVESTELQFRRQGASMSESARATAIQKLAWEGATDSQLANLRAMDARFTKEAQTQGQLTRGQAILQGITSTLRSVGSAFTQATSQQTVFGQGSLAASGVAQAAFSKLSAVVAGFFISLPQMARNAIREFQASGAAFAQLEGLVGIAHDQVNEWRGDLSKLAVEVAKSPAELAQGMFFITSAGLRGQQALDALTVSAKASAAGLGETKTIANAVTSAMNAYSKQNMQASQVTDILVAAVREGKLSAESLTPVIGRILPMASAMGVSFADVAGSMAVMSRTGMNAAEAGTAIRAMLMSFQKPTKQAKDALEEVGISIDEVKELIKQPGGLFEVIKQLNDKFKDNERGVSAVIPNFRALSGALNLLSQDGKMVEGVLENVRDASGSTQKAFEVSARGLGFAYRQQGTQIKIIFAEIGAVLAKMVLPVVRAFTAAWATAWGAAKQAAAAVYEQIEPIVEGVKELGAAAKEGILPLFAKAGGAFGKVWEDAWKKIAPLWQSIRSVVLDVIDAIKVALYNFGEIWDAVFTPAKGAAESLWESIKSGWDRLVSAIPWKDVASGLVGGFTLAVAGVSTLLGTLYQIFKSVFDLIAETTAPAIGWIGSFSGSLSSIVRAASVAAGAVAGVVLSVKLLSVAFSVASAVLGFFHVQQVLSALAWVAWTGAVIAAKVALFLFQAILSATIALMSVSYVYALIMGYIMLRAAIDGVIGIFQTVANTMDNAYQSGTDLVGGLNQLAAGAAGPLAAVSDLFREWGTILSDVARAAETDMPLAFDILKAGARLAVAQLQELWPPLWSFIRDGFDALWGYSTAAFRVAWISMLDDLYDQTRKTLNFFGIFGDVDKEMKARQEGILKGQKSIAETLSKRLQDVTKNFKVPDESDKVKELREELEKLRKQIGLPEDFEHFVWPEEKKVPPHFAQLGEGAGAALGEGMKKGFHDSKVDAVLSSSAEALSRIANQYASIFGGRHEAERDAVLRAIGHAPAAPAGAPGEPDAAGAPGAAGVAGVGPALGPAGVELAFAAGGGGKLVIAAGIGRGDNEERKDVVNLLTRIANASEVAASAPVVDFAGLGIV